MFQVVLASLCDERCPHLLPSPYVDEAAAHECAGSVLVGVAGPLTIWAAVANPPQDLKLPLIEL